MSLSIPLGNSVRIPKHETMDSHLFPSCTYLLAQQLNNSAARCIEIGHYGRAMASLKKALEINKKSKKAMYHYEKISTCYPCTLDGCIAYSEKNRSAINCSSSNDEEPTTKKRRLEETNGKRNIFWRPPSESITTTTMTTREDSDDDYIYGQPIRVDLEAGDMGGTLFLIIIFNLALAHHLQALGKYHLQALGKTRKRDTIVQKTLQLYQLTHECYLKLLGNDNKEASEVSSISSLVSCSSVASFRFNMILQNNISQLHRLVDDQSKYDRCRQHLLSSVMVVLDYKTRVKTDNDDNSTNTWNDPRAMEIEGFLTNTASLILGDTQCAQAA